MNSKKSKIVKISALIISGVFLAFVILASSCLEGLPTFSHQQHVKDQGMSCDDCHQPSADGTLAGAPDPEVCAACHEQVAKNMELAKELAKQWPRHKSLSPDGIFSHQTHKEGGITCDKCHGDMAKNKKVTFNILPRMADCMNCHSEVGVSTECSTCHREISRTSPPMDHRQGWRTAHGEAAMEPERGDQCFLCHDHGKCDSCHKVEEPRDHNASWREFGHGTMAQFDRNRCATCHKSDSCIRCHQEAVPRSHRAGWGPPSDRHCLGCHLTGGEESCYVCHGAGNKHLSAPHMPAGPVHSTATDCRSCHTGFLLEHPDNGEECTICHKP